MIINEVSNKKMLQYRHEIFEVVQNNDYGKEWGVMAEISIKTPDNESSPIIVSLEVKAPFIKEEKSLTWTSEKLAKTMTREQMRNSLYAKAVHEAFAWICLFRYVSGYNSNRSENFDYYKQDRENVVFIP